MVHFSTNVPNAKYIAASSAGAAHSAQMGVQSMRRRGGASFAKAINNAVDPATTANSNQSGKFRDGEPPTRGEIAGSGRRAKPATRSNSTPRASSHGPSNATDGRSPKKGAPDKNK